MHNLVAEIKRKPELKDLPDDLVISSLERYLSKHKIKIPDGKKERNYLIKIIRAELRRYAGQYNISGSAKKQKLVESGDFNELLKHHSSTKERINDYPALIKIISEISPKTILDLGCGLNPIAIATPKIFYHAYDIKSEDLEIVKLFFEKKHISGDIHHTDIRTVNTFPKVDLCLMFKLLDIIGENKSEIAENLISKIEAKYFIVSFATASAVF